MTLSPRSLSPAGARLQDWLDSHTLKPNPAADAGEEGVPPEIIAPREEGDDALTPAAFAALIDVDRSMLWRWMHGERLPLLKGAGAIEGATGIPAVAWLESADPSSPGT